YTLRVPPRRDYDMRLSWKTVERRCDGVPAGATDVDFAVPELGRLELRLIDSIARAPLRSSSEYGWGLAWREAGTQEFRGCAAEIDVTGSCRVDLPIGVVDLSLDLHADGYVPRVVTNVEVVARPSAPLTVELERSVALRLRIAGASALAPEIAEKHLV